MSNLRIQTYFTFCSRNDENFDFQREMFFHPWQIPIYNNSLKRTENLNRRILIYIYCYVLFITDRL